VRNSAGQAGLLLLLCACSVLEPRFRAEPEEEGAQPVTVKVAFEGASGISRMDLLRVVEDHMLDLSRRPTREAPVFDAALDLEDHYREAGYPDVQVTYAPSERSEDGKTLDVRFLVSEGPRVLVEPPDLQGNDKVRDETLLPLWTQRLSSGFGFGSPLLVEADLNAFVEAIRSYYWSIGHLEVAVAGPHIDRDGDRATVRIDIDEGPEYRIGRIEVDQKLLDGFGSDTPTPPSGAATIEAFRTWELGVRAKLRRRGYPDPQVVLTAHPDRARREVDLRMQGDSGRKAVIGEIEVRGNEQTATSLILDRLRLQTDTRYDGVREEEGLERLYRTGLFRKVVVRHEWIDDERIRMVVDVEELDSRSIDLLLGYGSYEQARVGLRFEERNLFGTGRDLLLESKLSARGHRLRATLTDPDIFSSGVTASISGETFRREEPSFTDRAAGGAFALSTQLLSSLRGRVGYSIADRFDTSVDVSDPTIVSDYRKGSVFAELNLDERDNPFYPLSGHQVFVSGESTAPMFGADVEFLRARVGFTLHQPIWERTRLVLHAANGWLWPGEGSARVPIQERYFLGGENTVRSFRESRIGPADPNGKPLGGEFSNFFGAELRVPVWRALEAAAFFDAGNVGSNVNDYTFSGLDYAVGVGLRLVLPIGPIRVDAAHNPDRERGESDWVVHFSVGYPF
jgi:outer membrane protein insertion porin family